MLNQLKMTRLDTEIMIDLQINAAPFKNRILFSRMVLIILAIVFLYFAYGFYLEHKGIWVFALILGYLFCYYEYRKNKNWINHAKESFLISKNNLKVSKYCAGKLVSVVDIDTQKIIQITYAPCVSATYPYLPNKQDGNIHIHSTQEGCSFGIGLSKDEAESFVIQLRSLIMEFQQPCHFIFLPHVHLKSDEIN